MGTRFKGIKATKRVIAMDMRGHPRRILPEMHINMVEKDEKCIRLERNYFEVETMWFVAWN